MCLEQRRNPDCVKTSNKAIGILVFVKRSDIMNEVLDVGGGGGGGVRIL